MAFPTDNITVRCYVVDIQAVQRAAELHQQTISEYCRELLLAWAYSDIGEDRPNFPDLERGSYAHMLAEAAKLDGVDEQTFARLAVERAAAARMGHAAPIPEPGTVREKRTLPTSKMHKRTESGTQEATRPGTYARRGSDRPPAPRKRTG